MCFSIYSDISRRSTASVSSNMNSARLLASSVFPTPVGPNMRKLPRGCSGSLRPARARRTALAMTFIACSWPMTLLPRVCSICSSLSCSSLSILVTGMPVHWLITCAICLCSTCSSIRSDPDKWSFTASSSFCKPGRME